MNEEQSVKKYERELQLIKKYLALDPGKPKYWVSAKTGVSLEIITELIEQGVLEEQFGELRVARHLRIKGEERRDLINRLSQKSDKHDEQRKDEKEVSKLLIDLEEKKKREKGIMHIRGLNKENDFER